MTWTEAERKREVAPLRGSWAVCYRPRDMGDNVTLTRDGAIATVTLCRPERRNALSDAMLTELAQAFAALRDDAATRVVVLTGAPPVFSAGADAPLSARMSPEERRRAFGRTKSQFRRLFERANTLLEGLEQTTVASINGHAGGGGRGVPLGTASTARFVRLVGPARAKEIILECRRYTAAEAQALGLVHRVVPGGDLRTAVRAYAEALAAKPQRPLAEAKARINAIARTGIPEGNAMTEGFLDRG